MQSSNLKSYILLGPTPPPIGGVSIHVLRFSKKYKVPVYDEFKIRKLRFLVSFLFLYKKTIYIHTLSWFPSFVVVVKRIFFNLSCKYYLVNHNFYNIYNPNKGLKAFIQNSIKRFFLKRCNKIYCVNEEVLESMERINTNADIELFDPFIPPLEEEKEKVLKTYSPATLSLLNNNYPRIISGAWQLEFFNNEDLYGFDLLIELAKEIKLEFNNFGLLLFLGNDNHNLDYIETLKKRIDKYNLKENVVFSFGQKEMWAAIEKSELYIRSTNTDGDPISIKEALYFGKKVLASDCVKRAEGVVLFSNRDLRSLAKKTIEIIKAID